MDTEDAKKLVVKRLLLAHSAWYDTYEGYTFAGRTFDGYAEFHSHGERYVLTRRAQLWAVDTHDYLFLLAVERLDQALLDELVAFMTTEALAKVEPKPDHMSSTLTLVVVADEVDPAAAKRLKKTRFRKTFKFGLEGWSDLRLAAVDLGGARVVANGAAANMRKTLTANATPVAPSAGSAGSKER